MTIDASQGGTASSVPLAAPTKSHGASGAFVAWVIKQCKEGGDKGAMARLARATSPSLEAQSWESLARFAVDLENEQQRLAYVAVGAAIATHKPAANGKKGLGACLAAAYPEGNQSDQAQARLRRLLACDDVQEVARVLRPLFALINSRGATPNYERLLGQLLYFNRDPQKIRAQWANEFYRAAPDKENP